MNVTQKQSQERRNKFYRYLLDTQKEYGIVHISLTAISEKLQQNRMTLNNDIRYFLEQELIKPFIVEAGVYQILARNSNQDTIPVINPNLPNNENNLNQMGFTEIEQEYIERFEKHRIALSKPITAMHYEMLIAELISFKNKGFNIVDCIKYSINGGYSKIFEPKNNQNNNNQLTYKETDTQNRNNRIDEKEQSSKKVHEAVQNWTNKYQPNNEVNNERLLTSNN